MGCPPPPKKVFLATYHIQGLGIFGFWCVRASLLSGLLLIWLLLYFVRSCLTHDNNVLQVVSDCFCNGSRLQGLWALGF